MNVKYYGEYDDLNNNRIKVEILVDSYSGSPIELLMSRPAVTINYNTEDVFQPFKKSGAEISFLVENVIEDLFTGALTSPKVRIYRNNVLFWWGYITPNIYTQPYKDEYDVLTLECIDSLAQLANKDFIQKTDVQSLLGVILEILFDLNIDATKIYYPDCVSLYNPFSPALANLYIQERNFYDEKNEPEKCDDVIGEMLKYLGFQMMQWKDAYFIFDYQGIKNGKYGYYCYDFNSGTTSSVTLDFTAKEITEELIGVGRGTVTLGGIYNKVTVIANTNPMGDVLPDFEDEEDLINQNEDPNKYYEESYTFEDVDNTLLSGFFKSKANWNYTQPQIGGGLSPTPLTPVDEVTLSNRDELTEATFWQKVDSYKDEDGEPSSLSWKTYLTFIGDGYMLPYLELANIKKVILNGGYLIFNMRYKLSTDARAHSVVKSMYDSSTFGTCTNLKWTDNPDYIGASNWPNDTMFRAKLSVGDYYYNGVGWFLTSDYQAWKTRQNAIYYGLGYDYAGTTRHWYRYINSSGDLEYITETMYSQSTATTKESGDCIYANAKYFYRYDNNEIVYVPNDFYNEFLYGDCFYLVHKNKTDENIYDVEYELTNTVSYKMNIADATDGVAIKCPDNLSIYGDFHFTLYPWNKLGTNPQYRTDNPTTTLKAIHISDLFCIYRKTSPQYNIYSTAVDPDTIYENVINSGYCATLEDFKLKVNTVTDNAVSYSFVMEDDHSLMPSDNRYSFNKYLYYHYSNNVTTDIPENVIVKKMTEFYSTPKYQYANTLKNDNITPFTLLTENNLNKTMIVQNVEYDMTDNNAAVTTTEL